MSDNGWRSTGSQPRLDMNLRHERAVHGAFVRDVQQASALIVTEGARQFHRAFDVVDATFFGLARLTVGCTECR